MNGDTALLVIDMQVAMFAEEDPVYDAENLLARVKSLITRARAAQMPVIYVRHIEDDSPMAYGAPGWQVQPDIAPQEGDLIVDKRFPDAFMQTNLKEELEARGIKKLIVAGLQTDCCIDTTCRSGFNLGYELTLVKDAHSTWNNAAITAPQIIAHHNLALKGWFVKLTSTEECLVPA
jgi:nicotinamidase-related amidase